MSGLSSSQRIEILNDMRRCSSMIVVALILPLGAIILLCSRAGTIRLLQVNWLHSADASSLSIYLIVWKGEYLTSLSLSDPIHRGAMGDLLTGWAIAAQWMVSRVFISPLHMLFLSPCCECREQDKYSIYSPSRTTSSSANTLRCDLSGLIVTQRQGIESQFNCPHTHAVCQERELSPPLPFVVVCARAIMCVRLAEGEILFPLAFWPCQYLKYSSTFRDGLIERASEIASGDRLIDREGQEQRGNQGGQCIWGGCSRQPWSLSVHLKAIAGQRRRMTRCFSAAQDIRWQTESDISAKVFLVCRSCDLVGHTWYIMSAFTSTCKMKMFAR